MKVSDINYLSESRERHDRTQSPRLQQSSCFLGSGKQLRKSVFNRLHSKWKLVVQKLQAAVGNTITSEQIESKRIA